MNAGGNEVKVNIIGRNKPKNCIFIIPDSLEKGNYKLIIKAPGYGDGELLIGRLKKPLTVKKAACRKAPSFFESWSAANAFGRFS